MSQHLFTKSSGWSTHLVIAVTLAFSLALLALSVSHRSLSPAPGVVPELIATKENGEQIRAPRQLAGEAAHASERLVAPITCWLIARAGVSPAEALQILEKWKARNFQQPD